jgi:hypothetical protein
MTPNAQETLVIYEKSFSLPANIQELFSTAS